MSGLIWIQVVDALMMPQMELSPFMLSFWLSGPELIVLLARNDSAERFGPSSGSIKCRA